MFWAFARTTPGARERYMRFSFYSMFGLGLFYIGHAVWGWASDSGPRAEHQAAFIAQCEAEGDDPKTCAALVEQNHDDCYTLSGGGTRSRRSGTSTQFLSERYARCLSVGVDAWRVERAAEVRAEKRDKKRNL